ncbi:HAMP domain-containing protein [Alteromonadaceae bacterium 2753L.S.0a.02]|nr:HAMP domain-containing protein [Alteromonadaceae bacterium 2753L.S.0a.02]
MLQSKMPITAQLAMLLILVLAMNAGAYFLILQNLYDDELKTQAETVVDNVEAFGAWVSRSGRVWVKDGAQDYLSSEPVITPNGDGSVYHFYSKNPALATREFSEVVAASQSRAKFRMTSHNVMNPANAPDAFEQIALQEIRTKKLNTYATSTGDQFRYAKAVIHKASCISCHGSADTAPNDVIERYGRDNGFGFKEGDIAGIISVTLPRKSLFDSSLSIVSLIEVLVIVLSIVPILWFVRRAVLLPVKRLTHAAEQISKGQETDYDIANVPNKSSNEIHQLMMATARMKNSFNIAMKKMNEARAQANKAIKYAKALKNSKE